MYIDRSAPCALMDTPFLAIGMRSRAASLVKKLREAFAKLIEKAPRRIKMTEKNYGLNTSNCRNLTEKKSKPKHVSSGTVPGGV